MKRVIILWAAGLMLAGGALWWGFQGDAQASHNPNAGYSHFNFIGGPGDSVSDDSPERAGWDRNADRTPDGDGEGSATDRTTDGVPDCLAGPGDGLNLGGGSGGGGPCGTPAGTGDLASDYFGMGDGNGPNTGAEAPDYIAVFNRVGDNFTDSLPEHPGLGKQDSVNDRVGVKDCLDVGECDRLTAGPTDEFPDRVGREGRASAIDRISDRNEDAVSDGVSDRNHDRVAAEIIAGGDDPLKPNRDGDSRGSNNSGVNDRLLARPNADGTSDGLQDRNLAGDSRTRGSLLHTQAARDAFATGPADRSSDSFLGGASDHAGFGFAADSGGCSLVAVRSASPSGLAYLLVLLTPVALVVLRRYRVVRR